jgi:hypothetical protein
MAAPRVPLTEVIHKLVDKWSFELLHKSKMGETSAMLQVAQIQFSHRPWGRIKPDPTHARRWLEYAAQKGDSIAHTSLQNLRTILAAHQHDLAVAREYGLIDLNKRGPDGKVIPPSQQLGLPPMSFSRIITHNVTNNLDATSEQAALEEFNRKFQYKTLSELLIAHKQKLLAEGRPIIQHSVAEPISYHNLEQQQARERNQALKDISSQVQKNLRKRVESGQMSPQKAADHIKTLQTGEHHMDYLRQARERAVKAQSGPKPSTNPQLR